MMIFIEIITNKILRYIENSALIICENNMSIVKIINQILIFLK